MSTTLNVSTDNAEVAGNLPTTVTLTNGVGSLPILAADAGNFNVIFAAVGQPVVRIPQAAGAPLILMQPPARLYTGQSIFVPVQILKADGVTPLPGDQPTTRVDFGAQIGAPGQRGADNTLAVILAASDGSGNTKMLLSAGAPTNFGAPILPQITVRSAIDFNAVKVFALTILPVAISVTVSTGALSSDPAAANHSATVTIHVTDPANGLPVPAVSLDVEFGGDDCWRSRSMRKQNISTSTIQTKYGWYAAIGVLVWGAPTMEPDIRRGSYEYPNVSNYCNGQSSKGGIF